jgi:hypothetical protein
MRMPLTEQQREHLRGVREAQLADWRAGRPQVVDRLFIEDEVVRLMSGIGQQPTSDWMAAKTSVDEVQLRSVTYAELSGLRHETFTSVERPFVTPAFLVIRYFGAYRDGASGRGDALYIIATAEAARKAWYSRCTVLDFQSLEYKVQLGR